MRQLPVMQSEEPAFVPDARHLDWFEAGYLAGQAAAQARISELETDLADMREEASYYYRQTRGRTFRRSRNKGNSRAQLAA